MLNSESHISNSILKQGYNIAKIVSFIRLKVGEGIEVESKNFADEVAEQLR